MVHFIIYTICNLQKWYFLLFLCRVMMSAAVYRAHPWYGADRIVFFCPEWVVLFILFVIKFG